MHTCICIFICTRIPLCMRVWVYALCYMLAYIRCSNHDSNYGLVGDRYTYSKYIKSKTLTAPPAHVGIVWSEGGGGQVTSLYKIWNETPRNHLEINGGTKAELQTEKRITKNKYNNVYVCNFFVVFFLIIFYCFFVCL